MDTFPFFQINLREFDCRTLFPACKVASLYMNDGWELLTGSLKYIYNPNSNYPWESKLKKLQLILFFLLLGLPAVGCIENSPLTDTMGGQTDKDIPKPLNLLLPQSIRIHYFTGTRNFDKTGGIKGIDVRIEAIDHYGDPTKAFGDFRFEMYSFLPNSTDPKGKRMAVWQEAMMKPEKNLLHWDKVTRTYDFKLQWNKPIPVGKRFVLVAVFSSPFTERFFSQRVFISGR